MKNYIHHFLFQEIKNDEKSIQCKRDECFVEIYTTHFTNFILSSSKSIAIEEVLLTVSAPSDSTLRIVELRVALHAHCSMLQDFRKQRSEVRNLNTPQYNDENCSKVMVTNFSIDYCGYSLFYSTPTNLLLSISLLKVK